LSITMHTLAALITDLAARGAERPALTCGERTVSFGELDARSSRAAHALRASGAAPGDRIAALAGNRIEYFELLFAAAKAGTVLTGLNTRLAAPEIAAILIDAAPALIFAGPGQRALLPDTLHARVIDLEDEYEPWIAAAPTSPPPSPSGPDDVVLQLYSSGTTGTPKGARLTSTNLLYTPRMGRESYRMGPDSVNLVPSPLFHIGGIGYALTTLGQGGHTILMPKADPATMLAAIEHHRITHAFLVPTIVAALTEQAEAEHPDLASLQVIAYGGAPMTETLLARAIDALGCAFLGVYGMTETAGSVTALAPEDHDPGGPRAGLLRSVGRSLPWHEVRVFDPASGEPLPAGQVGEIWVRSGQTTPGYWRLPSETADALTEAGWLRTGDAAYTDTEGYLYLHDRIKDLIISGGENVYPAEVENALASHPGIGEVAVIGVASKRWGETVKALVVPATGATPTAAELIDHARSRLAHYKCPTSVEFLDALPRNASGKIEKTTLREQYRHAPA
jgi:long-chain acyl-CoA synthetase